MHNNNLLQGLTDLLTGAVPPRWSRHVVQPKAGPATTLDEEQQQQAAALQPLLDAIDTGQLSQAGECRHAD